MERRLRCSSFRGACLLATTLLAAACGGRGERPDFLLVVVDTLRADHLSGYGYARPTSPRLDAVAAEGVLFERHRSQAPCTFPSMNSLLTSQPPQRFFAQDAGDLGIPADLETLATRLQRAGYATEAISSSPVVRATPSGINLRGGFEAGFDRFEESCLWQDASCVDARARQVLRDRDSTRPLFLFLHYLDPHGDYRPPVGHARRWASGAAAESFPQEVRDGNSRAAALRLDRGEPAGLGADELAHLVDLYDEEIAFVDASIGSLLADLRNGAWSGSAEARRDPLIAIASDHGESFLEHGTLAHCRTLYDAEIRTPWILAGAGVPRGKRAAGLSTNLDLVPTALDYLGLAESGGAFAGHSLRGAIERGAAFPEAQWAVSKDLRALTGARFKLIEPVTPGRSELYDLERDPLESRNLAGRRQRLLGGMRREIDRLGRPTASEREGAAESDRSLRALGYL